MNDTDLSVSDTSIPSGVKTVDEKHREDLDKLDATIRGLKSQPDISYPEPPARAGNNGGPPDLARIGELSARGIDRISVETSDQIREIGEAAVTHAEAIRAEANALADSILEQGRKFSDRVASFVTTAETMLQAMNEQRARLHKTKED